MICLIGRGSCLGAPIELLYSQCVVHMGRIGCRNPYLHLLVCIIRQNHKDSVALRSKSAQIFHALGKSIF